MILHIFVTKTKHKLHTYNHQIFSLIWIKEFSGQKFLDGKVVIGLKLMCFCMNVIVLSNQAVLCNPNLKG